MYPSPLPYAIPEWRGHEEPGRSDEPPVRGPARMCADVQATGSSCGRLPTFARTPGWERRNCGPGWPGPRLRLCLAERWASAADIIAAATGPQAIPTD